MNIREKTRAKYARFLSLTRVDEPRALGRIPMSSEGVPAIEAFHHLESEGRFPPTSEPALLERYILGKEIHGITVAMLAEDYAVNRIVTSEEIKANYPPWVAKEIFAQAAKLARDRISFVPTFVREQKDWSEAVAK